MWSTDDVSRAPKTAKVERSPGGCESLPRQEEREKGERRKREKEEREKERERESQYST